MKNGVLRDGLLANYSALTLWLQITGHVGGIHDWRTAGEGLNLEHLLKGVGAGVLVTELTGQGVSGTTGEYSRGAAGFWVENGQI